MNFKKLDGSGKECDARTSEEEQKLSVSRTKYLTKGKYIRCTANLSVCIANIEECEILTNEVSDAAFKPLRKLNNSTYSLHVLKRRMYNTTK